MTAPGDLRRAEAATWGPRPNTEPPPPRMKLLGFKPLVKGALRGFADVELPCGLRIRDVPILVGKNGAWANLPAKPQLDHDRRQKVDGAGKSQYVAMLEWRDRNLANRFSEAVVSLVRTQHPDALSRNGS